QAGDRARSLVARAPAARRRDGLEPRRVRIARRSVRGPRRAARRAGGAPAPALERFRARLPRALPPHRPRRTLAAALAEGSDLVRRVHARGAAPRRTHGRWIPVRHGTFADARTAREPARTARAGGPRERRFRRRGGGRLLRAARVVAKEVEQWRAAGGTHVSLRAMDTG